MGTTQQGQWTVKEKRVWVVVLLIGMVALFSNRMCLPVTIVEMAKELQWDKRVCGLILSSFYWGYLLPQAFGGWIADRHGGEHVLWIAGLLWSLAGASVAIVAYVSTLSVVAIRFVAGLAQGVHFPAVVCLMARRVDDKERSFCYGVINMGYALGPVILGCMDSLLRSAHSWPVLFVLFGVLGILWTLLLRTVATWSGTKNTAESDEPKGSVSIREFFSGVPWKQILTNRAIMATIFSHFCDSFLIHCLLSWSPTYFHDTFPSRLGSAWVYNSLPWVGLAVGSPLGGWIVHRLVDTCGMSMTLARKTIICTSLGMTVLCLLAIAALDQRDTTLNFTLATLFLFFAVAANGLLAAGPTMAVADMVPEHCGVVYGVMNSVCSLPGIVGVSLTGYLLHLTSSWPLVLSLIAAINLPGLAAFALFGSSARIHLEAP